MPVHNHFLAGKTIMKQSLKALAIVTATLTLGACAESPKCTSVDLYCGHGAYTEERTYSDNKSTTVSNIKSAAGEASPVFAEPTPTPTPAEPITEIKQEPAPVPAPVAVEPAPADTQVMQKADQTPAMKSMK
jgi:hypothetical protein